MAIDQPVLGNCYFTISANKTEIIEGDNVQFTIELFGGCPMDISVRIFIDNIVDNQYLSNGSLLYTHTFNESGEFTVSVDGGDGSSIVGDSINITVEEATIELSISQVSWEINNKNVQLIEINNKEVQSIVVKDTGDILFQKSNGIENLPVMTLMVTATSFSTYSSSPFIYNGRVFVDWGDESGFMEYTGGELSHNFTDGKSKHIIQVYGDITSLGSYCFLYDSDLTSIELPSSVTSLENACFGYCDNLTSIALPDTVTSLKAQCFDGCTSLIQINIPKSATSLANYCFRNCSGLSSIHLNWSSSTNILTYRSNWITYANSTLKFIIPYGTTQLYIDKGYPSDKLEEVQPLTLWVPELNGETGANYLYSYSESNGEAVGKGFVLKNGFDNIDNWELSFEFKHDNIQYTGICFLTDLANGYKGDGISSTALTTWEGSWPNGSAYARYNSGAVGYFDITVTKIDSTHVRLQSSALDRDTTVELSWLSSAEKLSIGARHNNAVGGNMYGPCRIRNIIAKQKIIQTNVDDDGEVEGATMEINP